MSPSVVALLIGVLVLHAGSVGTDFVPGAPVQEHIDEEEHKGAPWLDTNVPKFVEQLHNVTVPVGRDAVLTCVVDNLSTYRVAWLQVETQTILTVQTSVITKNHRIALTHADMRTWYLHIKEVQEKDRGFYMCQINTDPMKSQQGYLDIVVPPDILDHPTSTDMVVREFSNATLRCAATGSPAPNITWRREDGRLLQLPSGKEAPTAEGATLSITRATRDHMGAYLCIASNGVPPSVSKRIWLTVEFPPVIESPSQLVGARVGRPLVLECRAHAFPRSINYWTKGPTTLAQGVGYETEEIQSIFSVHMILTIRSVAASDFGEYKCVSKNYLGETEQSIKVDHVRTPDTSWAPVATKASKHGKGKSTRRPVSENSVEIPDAEESTASSAATLVVANVFLALLAYVNTLWQTDISRTSCGVHRGMTSRRL